MEINWTDDQVILIIDKAELASAKPEIVDGVWSACQIDERIGRTVGNFFVLGLAIMIKGCLQFMNE